MSKRHLVVGLFLGLALCCIAVLVAAQSIIEYVHGQSDFEHHIDFDGNDVRLHHGQFDFLSSALHNAKEDSRDTRYPATRSEKVWTLFNGVVSATVHVRWRNDNPNDYVSWGWWRKDEATPHDSLIDSSTYIYSFLSGPEFPHGYEWQPHAVSIPVRGVAAYSGRFYGFHKSGDFEGEFESRPLTLEVDFTTGKIEGCVGCQYGEQGIVIVPVDYNSRSGIHGRNDAQTFRTDFTIWFQSTSLYNSHWRHGSFDGGVDVRGGKEEWDGWHHGRFSTISDREGNPRSLGILLSGGVGRYPNRNTGIAGVIVADSLAYVHDLESDVR